MFFDEIKLTQNSWHYKLQEFVFGHPPNLWSFCPYFWLTIFCLFVGLPVVLFVKLVAVYPFLLLDKFLLRPAFDDWMDRIGTEDYYSVYGHDVKRIPRLLGKSRGERFNIAWERILKREGIEPNTEKYHEFLNRIEDKWRDRVARKLRRERKREEDEGRQEYREHVRSKWDAFFDTYFSWVGAMSDGIYEGIASIFIWIDKEYEGFCKSLNNITKIVIWTKKIASTLFTILIAYVLIKMILFLFLWWHNLPFTITLPDLIFAGKIILLLLGFAMTMYGVVPATGRLFSWIFEGIESNYDKGNWIYRALMVIGSFFTGIGNIFKTLWKYI